MLPSLVVRFSQLEKNMRLLSQTELPDFVSRRLLVRRWKDVKTDKSAFSGLDKEKISTLKKELNNTSLALAAVYRMRQSIRALPVYLEPRRAESDVDFFDRVVSGYETSAGKALESRVVDLGGLSLADFRKKLRELKKQQGYLKISEQKNRQLRELAKIVELLVRL